MPGILKYVWFLLLIVLFVSCSKTETEQITIPVNCPVQAADVSFLPQIEAAKVMLYNQSGQAEDMLTTLKNAGCNTIRLRLWYAPADGHSGFAEVKTMVQRAKAFGLKVWLTVHYSDT